MSFTVAVAGASGFAGGEILRLLLNHPEFEIGALSASSSVGDVLGVHHPHLQALAKRKLVATDAQHLGDHDLVFLALPHGASAQITQELRDCGSKAILVDAGADHRLVDPQAWRDYYHSEPAKPWAYAMPELAHFGENKAFRQREILANSREIAVPGCNVTAVTFALLPAVLKGMLDTTDLVATLAVGYSGAGKALKPHLLASAALGNAQGYSMAGSHRHIPEIIQNLKIAGATQVNLAFTPILVPMNRGILATVSAPLSSGINPADLRPIYEQYCAQEPLLDLLAEGSWPQILHVTGSARVALQVDYDERAGKVIAQCAIDNLGKGTAAAAIQGANLALGLPELSGIPMTAIAP